MVGVGWPRIAIDAAMLAAAIGVDRAVERDVGRLVEADDRAGVFFGYGSAQFGGWTVDDFAFVEPVQVSLARVQPEALRDVGGRGTAAVDRGFRGHW